MAAPNPTSDVNCSICAQIYIKPAVLPCGHTFCKDCLSTWLDQRRVCPHCRKKVPVRYKPIALSGWDDHLDALALQLPEDEQQERLVVKRLREDDGDKVKPAKRRRRNAVEDTFEDDQDEFEFAEYGSNQALAGYASEPVDNLADGLVDDLDYGIVNEAELQNEAPDDPDWELDYEQDFISGSDEDLGNNVVDEEVNDGDDQVGVESETFHGQGTYGRPVVRNIGGYLYLFPETAPHPYYLRSGAQTPSNHQQVQNSTLPQPVDPEWTDDYYDSEEDF